MLKIIIPEYINIEDFKRVQKHELASYLEKDIGEKNWRRSIETNELHAFRRVSLGNNEIVGLFIFNNTAPKADCVECYVKVA